MNEHKRTVVTGYPVERLPEDLRAGREPGHKVVVTVEDEVDRLPAMERLKRLREVGAHHDTSIEEAVARVRALRDEWD